MAFIHLSIDNVVQLVEELNNSTRAETVLPPTINCPHCGKLIAPKPLDFKWTLKGDVYDFAFPGIIGFSCECGQTHFLEGARNRMLKAILSENVVQSLGIRIDREAYKFPPLQHT